MDIEKAYALIDELELRVRANDEFSKKGLDKPPYDADLMQRNKVYSDLLADKALEYMNLVHKRRKTLGLSFSDHTNDEKIAEWEGIIEKNREARKALSEVGFNDYNYR